MCVCVSSALEALIFGRSLTVVSASLAEDVTEFGEFFARFYFDLLVIYPFAFIFQQIPSEVAMTMNALGKCHGSFNVVNNQWYVYEIRIVVVFDGYKSQNFVQI